MYLFKSFLLKNLYKFPGTKCTMGVGTHYNLCEYLLLQKHPDGYTEEELLTELENRGWDYDKDPTFYKYPNWVKGNVWLFCQQHIRDTVDLIRKYTFDKILTVKDEFSCIINEDWDHESRPDFKEFISYFCNNFDVSGLRELASSGDYGSGEIYYGLDCDDKFKFYPHKSGTLRAWHHHINLLEVGMNLSDDELWFASDKNKGLRSRINIYLGIAEWFCEKFDKDFYSICHELNLSSKYIKIHVKGKVNDKLKNLTPEFFKDI